VTRFRLQRPAYGLPDRVAMARDRRRLRSGRVPAAPFAWTHERTRVEFDGQALTINDRLLALDRIERLEWDAWQIPLLWHHFGGP
jgi:hypothetical protein